MSLISTWLCVHAQPLIDLRESIRNQWRILLNLSPTHQQRTDDLSQRERGVPHQIYMSHYCRVECEKQQGKAIDFNVNYSCSGRFQHSICDLQLIATGQMVTLFTYMYMSVYCTNPLVKHVNEFSYG